MGKFCAILCWLVQQTEKPSFWEPFRRPTSGKRLPGRVRAWLHTSTCRKPGAPCRRCPILPGKRRCAVFSRGIVLSGP